MHTFKTEQTTIQYNSDLSGEVRVRNARGDEIEVNGECLLQFVSEYLRGRVVAFVERIDVRAVLRELGR